MGNDNNKQATQSDDQHVTIIENQNVYTGPLEDYDLPSMI